MVNFEKEKISTTEILTSHFKSEARLSLWIQILPSLGTTQFHKIQDTVTFASPADLVAAVELVIYRDRDGEKLQLQLELWQSSLAVEGGGDPIRFHRYILLASKKLALLNDEQVRDCVPYSSKACLMIFFCSSKQICTTMLQTARHSLRFLKLSRCTRRVTQRSLKLLTLCDNVQDSMSSPLLLVFLLLTSSRKF